MPLKITFLGHSGFLFEADGRGLAVDPFLTGNPVAKHRRENIRCDYVALSHGHGDHLGDTVAIAKANSATVIATFEICEYCTQQGVKKTQPGNTGGKIETEFGFVAFTQAFHSSSFEGRYMGMPCGLVIRMGGVTIYHCGDTALFGDMKLIGELYKPDIACIPVGDRFTMGPEHGARAAELIGARTAIPMHYGTFDLLVSDISAFRPRGVEVKAMEVGEVWEVEGP